MERVISPSLSLASSFFVDSGTFTTQSIFKLRQNGHYSSGEHLDKISKKYYIVITML
jgi:hypothetical protein